MSAAARRGRLQPHGHPLVLVLGVLAEAVDFDGRDCDGRVSSSHVWYTTPPNFQNEPIFEPCTDLKLALLRRNRLPPRAAEHILAGGSDPQEWIVRLKGEQIFKPSWHERSASQRDYSAEAAGY